MNFHSFAKRPELHSVSGTWTTAVRLAGAPCPSQICSPCAPGYSELPPDLSTSRKSLVVKLKETLTGAEEAAGRCTRSNPIRRLIGSGWSTFSPVGGMW